MLDAFTADPLTRVRMRKCKMHIRIRIVYDISKSFSARFINVRF